MAKKDFGAVDTTSPVNRQIHTAVQEQPPEPFYRFSLKLPAVCEGYLKEMAWRNRITITEYLTRLVQADMNAHAGENKSWSTV